MCVYGGGGWDKSKDGLQAELHGFLQLFGSNFLKNKNPVVSAV